MEEKKPAPSTLLPTLSPEEVHRNIVRCHKLRSRVDRKLLYWLGILIEKGYALQLGSPGPVSYVRSNLLYERSEAYSVVQAAKALPRIPRTADAFEAGTISWCQLKAISSLKKVDETTEGTWLEFARTHSADELREEVKDAKRRGRNVPRKAGSAILNRHVHLDFSLTLADRELIRKALEKKAAEMVASGKYKEGERPTPEEVLLALCREILETEVPGGGSDRVRAFCDMVFLSAAGIL